MHIRLHIPYTLSGRGVTLDLRITFGFVNFKQISLYYFFFVLVKLVRFVISFTFCLF